MEKGYSAILQAITLLKDHNCSTYIIETALTNNIEANDVELPEEISLYYDEICDLLANSVNGKSISPSEVAHELATNLSKEDAVIMQQICKSLILNALSTDFVHDENRAFVDTVSKYFSKVTKKSYVFTDRIGFDYIHRTLYQRLGYVALCYVDEILKNKIYPTGLFDGAKLPKTSDWCQLA